VTETAKRSVVSTLGKLALDFSKITFGSFVIGAMLMGEAERTTILMVGLAFTGAFVLLGIIFVAVTEE